MSNTYTTISGDMWDGIAYKTLGDVLKTDTLMKANIKYANIITFPAGIELTIPAVEEEVEVALPPWKRGLL